MKLTHFYITKLITLCIFSTLFSQIPETLSYQGVLQNEDGSPVVDGTYSILFEIADDEDHQWSETLSVSVVGGVFSVILGSDDNKFSNADIDFSESLTLTITYDGVEFSPIELTSSAYSMASRSVVGETNVFPSSGSVGIGIDNPVDYRELHVHSDSNTDIHLTNDLTGSGPSSGGSITMVGDGNVKDLLVNNREEGNLNLLTQSSVRVTIDESGKVGMGNTDPDYDLDVTGDINFTGNLYQNGSPFGQSAGPFSFLALNSSDNSDGYYYGYNSNYKNTLYHYSNFSIGIYQPNWELMTQPWMRVGFDSEAEDGFSAYGGYLFLGANTSSIGHYNNATAGMILSSNNSEGGNLFVFGRTDDSFIATGSGDDVALSAELVVIDKDGNMGIGINNPSDGYKLDVTGSVLAEDLIATTGSGVQTLLAQSSDNSAVLKTVTDFSNYQWTANGFTDEFYLYDNNAQNGAGAMRLHVNSSGNMGIGMSASSYTKLDVGGELRAVGQISLAGNLKYYSNADFFQIKTQQVTGIQFEPDYTNTNPAMTITPEGDVAIGSVTAWAPLHINSDSVNSHIRLQNNWTGVGWNDGSTISIETNTNDFVINQRENAKIRIYNNEQEVMIIGSNGNVGIGGIIPDDSYALDINGHVQAQDWSSNSDVRWKKDIRKLSGSLEKIKNLNGYHYNWKDKSRGEELQVGLIAQEIETIFPELITTDSKGYKSVSYGKMVAPLIEAVKELEEENETLENRIEDLEKKMEILISLSGKNKTDDKFGYLDK